MWNLGVRTPQRWFLHSFLQACSQWIEHRNWLIHCHSFLGLCLVFFAVKGNKIGTRWSDEKDKTFPLSVVCVLFFFFFFFLLNLHGHLVSANTVVFFMFISCLYLWLLTGTPAFCFSLVFERFYFVLVKHTRPNWGLFLALQCPGKMARKGEVVLWTSDTFHFILLCHMPLFYKLASLCSLAIFENQTIVMSRQFKQWYLLLLSWGWIWMKAVCYLDCSSNIWGLGVVGGPSVACKGSILNKKEEISFGVFKVEWWVL